MTRVLVVTASRHGSTAGIGQRIQAELRAQGVDATLDDAPAARGPEGFDAVVLGSAVYAARWMPAMKEYATRHQDALRARPVFLFSSGPLGDPPVPAEAPPDAAAMVALTRAREHVTFAGSLRKEDLSLAEKAMVRMVKAPYGDFRPWPAVVAWARSIAARIAVTELNA